MVLNFFKDKDLDTDHAKIFFDYYQERDWLTSDGLEVRDWRALALYWAEKKSLARQKKKLNQKEESQLRDNLRTTKNKDYGQPL